MTFVPGRSNNNLVSLPCFFHPNGNVNQSPQNSLDLCRDANNGGPPSRVPSVIRYITSFDVPKTQSCGTTIKAFDLTPGEGYSIHPAGPGIVIDLVGAHDDSFAPNKTNPPFLKLYPLVYQPGFINAKTQGRLSTIKAFDLIPGEALIVKPIAPGLKIGLDVY